MTYQLCIFYNCLKCKIDNIFSFIEIRIFACSINLDFSGLAEYFELNLSAQHAVINFFFDLKIFCNRFIIEHSDTINITLLILVYFLTILYFFCYT